LLAGAAVVAVMAGLSSMSVGLPGQIAAGAAVAVILAIVGSYDRAGALQAQMTELQGRLLAETEARNAQAAAAARAQSMLDEATRRTQAADANHQLVKVNETAELTAVIKGALDGNLLDRVSLQGKSGVLAALGSSLNELLDGMAGTIRQIQSVSLEVNRGAEEISAGNSNLSQRTEEQSSSLEETASSMEQMTTTVKQNAANAGQANQLAIAARGQAESGGTVVGKAISAMSEINRSSKKIADIIGVIDEIAFQTNLLALNAAVEAARAGEQGRGFAVVASEVRSLAGRSATAAKEIKALIQDSVRKVEDGSKLVTESGHTLEQIVVSVKKVSDIVAEIAAASREQSSGIEQVNRAVMQMDELTQQNAALVEEATAASRSMAEQARGLSHMMGRYQVSNAGSGMGSGVGVAASTMTPASVRRPAPAGAERRDASRPWVRKGSRAAAQVAAPAPAPVLPRTGTGHSEWQEF
jgi:methyl-accepting chemotaxis protein